MKTKTPLFILLTTLTILMLTGCTLSYDKITEADINQYAKDGAVEKLTGFLSYAAQKEENLIPKDPLVRQTIDLLLTQYKEKAMPELEKHIANTAKNGQNQRLTALILAGIHQKNIKPGNMEPIWDIAIAEPQDGPAAKEAKTLIQKNPTEAIPIAKQKLQALHSEGDTIKYKNILPILEQASTPIPDNLKKMVRLHETYIKQNGEIEKAKKDAARIDEGLKKAQEDGLPQGDILELTAYMVQQIGDNQYEIAMLEKREFLGEVPSDKHAFLETVKTQYTSKGRFSLMVVKTGTKDVELTQAAGNFKQKWDVYKEIPPELRNKAQSVIEMRSDKTMLTQRMNKYTQWRDEADQDFQKAAKN